MNVTAYLMNAMLTDATTGTLGILTANSIFLGVATSVVNNGVGTSLANITPAVGEISTPVAVSSWTGPYTLASGRSAIEAPKIDFTVTNPSVPQQVVAWYLTTATVGGSLLGWGMMGPYNLFAGGSPAGVVLRITLDPLGQWSAEVTFNG